MYKLKWESPNNVLFPQYLLESNTLIKNYTPFLLEKWGDEVNGKRFLTQKYAYDEFTFLLWAYSIQYTFVHLSTTDKIYIVGDAGLAIPEVLIYDNAIMLSPAISSVPHQTMIQPKSMPTTPTSNNSQDKKDLTPQEKWDRVMGKG